MYRGVFNEDDTDSDIEADFERDHKAGSYFGKRCFFFQTCFLLLADTYAIPAHHARKQLAFDIWWLAFALWASKALHLEYYVTHGSHQRVPPHSLHRRKAQH